MKEVIFLSFSSLFIYSLTCTASGKDNSSCLTICLHVPILVFCSISHFMHGTRLILLIPYFGVSIPQTLGLPCPFPQLGLSSFASFFANSQILPTLPHTFAVILIRRNKVLIKRSFFMSSFFNKVFQFRH